MYVYDYVIGIVKLSWMIKDHTMDPIYMLGFVRIYLHLHSTSKHISVSGALFNAASRSLAEMQREEGDHITHCNTKSTAQIWKRGAIFIQACVLSDR